MPDTTFKKTAPITMPDSPPNPTPTPLALTGKRLHFVGIGGCGMSGLARMSHMHGATCSGTDRAESATLDMLRAEGIGAGIDQSGDAMPADLDLMVVSAAIKPDHPEIQRAQQRHIPIMKYAQLLGQLMIGRTGVAIAGTHGKSSTTSMLAHILIQSGLDPNFIVGANCNQIGGGYRVGQSDILLAEACEYDRSFHNFHPTHATILNVEADHLDMYSSIDEIVEAFAVFARKIPAHGSLLIQHESPHRLDLIANLTCPVETIGYAPHADWQLRVLDSKSEIRNQKSEITATWTHPIPGEHMAYNAAVAAVTAHRLGASWPDISRALESFQGLDRRMQTIGQRDGITIVDDYGHHPTEIDTTLRALRQHHQPKRLICVFQPHQHSRTRFLLDQFAASFSDADLIIVPDIYFVRDSEQERASVSSDDLVNKLRHAGKDARHIESFDAIVEHLTRTVRDGDLLVTMGAGDVYRIAQNFLSPPAPPTPPVPPTFPPRQ